MKTQLYPSVNPSNANVEAEFQSPEMIDDFKQLFESDEGEINHEKCRPEQLSRMRHSECRIRVILKYN